MEQTTFTYEAREQMLVITFRGSWTTITAGI